MKTRLFTVFALLILLFSSIVYVSPAQAAPPASAWCGKLSSYTAWTWSDYEKIWKPALFVWKGVGRGNPYAVSVYYNGNYVPNADDAIRVSSPQIDKNNGWVGYYLAKRWYGFNWNWDDDWRWEVRACLP